MTEILEIDKSATYRIGSLEIPGNELIHKVANGIRYEELSNHMKESVKQWITLSLQNASKN